MAERRGAIQGTPVVSAEPVASHSPYPETRSPHDMELLSEPIPGVFEVRARVFADARGSMSETFNRRTMASLGIDADFVQENESRSTHRGTVRGLHLQADPHAQGKLVRVIRGAILDVAVDLRPDSRSRLEHVCVELRENDARALWIPPGFAHGFCTLAEDTVVTYKVTDFYAPETEQTIRFDDPDLGIDWPVTANDAVLSDKDAAAFGLADYLESAS